MDSEQAKRVLALYRADISDPDDKLMAEALEQVQRDPELAAWFERQSAVNQAIRAKLKSIPVPADLHKRILENQTSRGKVVPFPKYALATLAAAAAIAAMFFIWQNQTSSSTDDFPHYVDHLARGVQRPGSYFPPMEFVSTNQSDLRAWFQTRGVSTNFALPPSIDKLTGEGAAVVTWQNHTISSLCLTNASATNEVWAFITDLPTMRKAPALGQPPQLRPVGRMMTASWSAGDKVYLVVAAGTEASMQDYLH